MARARPKEHRGVRSDCNLRKMVWGCTCKKIFHASILNERKERCLMALRNKTLAVTMILNGWHPIDAYRLKETDVTDVPDYRDRSGEHRPKIIFAGQETHHTKVHSIKVRNTIGCGCQGNHDPRDERCFYNGIKDYIVEKDKSDELFMREVYPRLNKVARLVHVDPEGDLRPINFFRAMSRKGEERCTSKMTCIFTRTWEIRTCEESSSGGTRNSTSPPRSAWSRPPLVGHSAPSDTSTPRESVNFDVMYNYVTWVWCSFKSLGRASWPSHTTCARRSSGSIPRKLGAHCRDEMGGSTDRNGCPQKGTHTLVAPSTSGATAADEI